jgi:ankyrin repeat protein
VERGADVNEKAPAGLNALLLAIDSGRDSFAQFLIEKGADPNAADADGLTALHYSLRKGISLLRGGTDNSNNANQEYLFRPNMQELIKALLDHGANPNARITRNLKRLGVNDRPMLGLAGATPFLLAAATGDVEIMRILLAKAADPKLATNDNTTPLMVAAGVGRWRGDERPKDEEKQALEAVKMLVELGADVNAVSNDLVTNIPGGGLTALHGAAYTGANEIVQYLVEKGGRLDAKDFFGMTPLSVAEGDPNGLMADFSEGKRHESTASLIRKLGGYTVPHGDEALLSPAPAK